jgi:hypothetical protein
MRAIAVFAAALATAVATGLGALPFAVERHGLRGWLGPANGVASGGHAGRPEALSYGPRRAVAADTTLAFVLMLVLQLRLAT